ncbi:hypothetical protein QWM81_15345 [Streptomyces ficellus]|uniref:Uncharacterized protein n=1 Tax=Streptomyces ficellus TaxID=1977088 RepID=A0ABT7Z7E2_9ACTN|nr:hypothetical protein [Streptomyces ficellus]MDN3295404.1 hypothetical protein [Streptomyces ficellus]
MATILLDRPVEQAAHEAPETAPPPWVPLLLAGDMDDDGSEPHICRGID